MSFVKTFIGIILLLLIEKLLISQGFNCNFSFLLIFIFVINYYFPQRGHRKVNPSEVLPLGFFVLVGILEDLFQGIIGPFIISKTLTGLCLIALIQQIFFYWSIFFKSFIIFLLTALDSIIYAFVISNFLHLKFTHFLQIKSFLEESLLNILIGLILTKGKP